MQYGLSPRHLRYSLRWQRATLDPVAGQRVTQQGQLISDVAVKSVCFSDHLPPPSVTGPSPTCRQFPKFCRGWCRQTSVSSSLLRDKGAYLRKVANSDRTCAVANGLRSTSHERYDLFTKRVAKFASRRKICDQSSGELSMQRRIHLCCLRCKWAWLHV